MRFDVITIFPEVLKAYFNSSILARAQNNKKIKINVVNLRDFSTDRHNKIDDKPYGGGPGMVMNCRPVFDAVEELSSKFKVKSAKLRIVLLSPQGKPLSRPLSLTRRDRKTLITK